MRGVLFRAATALVLVTCAVNVGEASIMEPVATEAGMICASDGSQCYSAVFEATDSWQEVLPDQVIPGGLHVRLNFETGQREAKLVSDDDDEEHTGVVVVSEGASADITLKNPQDQVDDTSAKVDSQQSGTWGKSPYSHKPNPHISLSEHQEFENNLAFILSSFALKGTESSTSGKDKNDNGPPESTALESVRSNIDESQHELLIAALRNVEDFSHEIDFGIKLAAPEVISIFLTLVNTHSSPQVRALSARIIGSSLQNNEPALQIATVSQVVTNLLQSLEQEQDPTVRYRIMFALASSIHGKFGRAEFWKHKGGDILRKYFFAGSPDEDFLGRVGTFVEDSFVNDKMNIYGSSDTPQPELEVELGLWCSAFQDALARDNIASMDVREKIFSSLSAIKLRFPTYCPIQDNFRRWIAEKVEQRAALRRQKHEAQEDLSSSLSTVDGHRTDLDTIPGQELVFLDKLSDVRHSLFGNPKAGRKTLDLYHDEL
ncbi:hypothetical protein V1525DRAFT_404426 [Lipomyces kononenkoae]|uniref:Uncharacterized protein n=1 Tax=Lipomyces kononenkoae TaxID=34357 RepID=A0ACC3T0X4_LIPKO